MDRDGQVVHTTGPVPRALMYAEISSTKAESQVFSVDGWHGLATRIMDTSAPTDYVGWLVVASRRADFPDTYATAAVHVAASLIETSQRMTVVVGQQERAVRAAVLEQALAMKPERHDAELAARVAGLGMTFETEVRVVVATFLRTPRAEARQQSVDALADLLGRALGSGGHPFLMTPRGNGVTALVSCNVAALQRLLVGHRDVLPELNVGIGRPIDGVGHVVDSYNDAQLAVRTLRRVARDQRLMAYEDFDFAIRLFADVGLETMVAWAHDFLRPLDGRDNLVAGLRAYFEHDQNINLAADALNLHHNSLRYRLAKVEELLTLNLKQPAAVSSVFLALTAIDLSASPRSSTPRKSGQKVEGTADSDAPSTATAFSAPERATSGVVFGPES
jgi:sugar diacid utilization regulator